MKRERETNNNYIQWLKSIGCVFYAPMDEANGMKDLIGNTMPVFDSGCTATYDATEDAHLIHLPNTANLKIIYNVNPIDFGTDVVANMSLEAMSNVKFPTYNGKDFYFTQYSQTGYSNRFWEGDSSLCVANSWVNIGTRKPIGTGTVTMWYNATDASSNTSTLTIDRSVTPFIRISNVHSWAYPLDRYCKNFYFFNRELTNEQRTKILEHDGVL